MKFALLLAIETFSDPAIAPIPGVLKDAEQVSSLLDRLEILKNNRIELIGDQATQSRIRSKLRSLRRQLTPDDELLVFVWTRGFSDTAENYLACHDTYFEDAVETAVSWREFWEPALTLAAGSTLAFVALPKLALSAEPVSMEVFEASAGIHRRMGILLAGTDTPELAYLPLEKQTAWGQELVQLLDGGRTPRTSSGPCLGDPDFLATVQSGIEHQLRKAYSVAPPQSIRWFGNRSLKVPAVDPRADALPFSEKTDLLDQTPGEIKFFGRSRRRIRQLKAYRSGLRIPTEYSDRTIRFVKGLAEEDIADELSRLHQLFRQELGMKRKDLDIIPPEDGLGAISTPDFTLSIAVQPVESELSELDWVVELGDLTNWEPNKAQRYDQVLAGLFSGIRITLSGDLNLEEVIDRVESHEADGLRLDYPPDLSRCRLGTEGSDIILEVTPREIECQFPSARSMIRLVDSVTELKARYYGLLGIDADRIT